EGLRLLAADAHAPLRDDAQAGLLDHRIDRAREIARGCVRLEDGKRTLDGHRRSTTCALLRDAAAYSGRLRWRQSDYNKRHDAEIRQRAIFVRADGNTTVACSEFCWKGAPL